MKKTKIDTKEIRTRLMAERKKEKPENVMTDGYYDGVLDTLIEVDKCQLA